MNEKVKIYEFEKYISEGNSFALDDLTYLKEELVTIREKDSSSEVYCVSYPVLDDGFVYSDNLLIGTKLVKEEVASILSTHRDIEPYYVEVISEDEITSIDFGINDLLSKINDSYQIYSIYWD